MVVLISLLMTLPGVLDKASIIQEATTEKSNLENTISKTFVESSSLQATLGSDVISFTFTNIGTEKLWDFEEFDLFITYQDMPTDKKTESPTYAGVCSGDPVVGTWCSDPISFDIQDPGILNQYEDFNVRATVNDVLATGIVIVNFSTDKGILTSISTTV